MARRFAVKSLRSVLSVVIPHFACGESKNSLSIFSSWGEMKGAWFVRTGVHGGFLPDPYELLHADVH